METNGSQTSGTTTDETGTETVVTNKKRRGFRAMDPAKQREIASKGGEAAHAAGTAHEFSPEVRRARRAARAAARRGRSANRPGTRTR